MLHEHVEETEALRTQMTILEGKMKVYAEECVQVKLNCRAKEEELQVVLKLSNTLSTRVLVLTNEVEKSDQQKAKINALSQCHLEEFNKVMLEKQSDETELKDAMGILEPGFEIQSCLREKAIREWWQLESTKDEKISYYQLGYEECKVDFKNKLLHLSVELLDASRDPSNDNEA